MLARAWAGEARLPPATEMMAEIEKRRERSAGTLHRRSDSLIRVALIPYLDELAAEIGARPRLWRRPWLAPALLIGPPIAAQYRLDGPNRWERTEDVMRTLMAHR